MEAMIAKELNEIVELITRLENKVTQLGVKKVATKGSGTKDAFELYFDSVKDDLKTKNPDLNASALRAHAKKIFTTLLTPEVKAKWINMELDAVQAQIKKAKVSSLKDVAPEASDEVKQQVKEKIPIKEEPSEKPAAPEQTQKPNASLSGIVAGTPKANVVRRKIVK